MNFAVSQIRPLPLLSLICLFAAAGFTTAQASPQKVPPEATQAMDKIYSGDLQAAMVIVRSMEIAQPESPLGFLLEGDALWWQIYCDNSEIKYGMVDAWKRGKKTDDESYFTVADKVISLAEAQLAKSNSAEMHLYAGDGYALKARLYGLRGENRAVARAGVAARTEFLAALELDPQMADATAGLGLYNYYVDSLSSIVKVLRFFMGIPGGDRDEGLRQIQVGIDHGVLSQVEMRFYLAKALRNYDRDYEKALAAAGPLGSRYPYNSIFQLLLGNLNVELVRMETAAEYFHAAAQPSSGQKDCSNCSACQIRTREIASTFLAEKH